MGRERESFFVEFSGVVHICLWKLNYLVFMILMVIKSRIGDWIRSRHESYSAILFLKPAHIWKSRLDRNNLPNLLTTFFMDLPPLYIHDHHNESNQVGKTGYRIVFSGTIRMNFEWKEKWMMKCDESNDFFSFILFFVRVKILNLYTHPSLFHGNIPRHRTIHFTFCQKASFN